MTDAIAVVNAGSSSLKFAVLAARDLRPLVSGQIEGLQTAPHVHVEAEGGQVVLEHRWAQGSQLSHEEAVAYLLANLHDHLEGHQLKAVGHRIVHGGAVYSQPVVLTPEVLTQLQAFVPLAPLHQPHNLNGIRAIATVAPDVRQVACFDTAFHRSNPPVAQAFAIPRELTAEGIKRYGFHGLSYEFIARVLPEHTARADGRVIVAHLGNGSSLCGMTGRRSIASTMGFTAIDGLMMGTRSGAIDPGVLLYLIDNKGMGSAGLTHLLYKESGLLGVSGISQDMRTLLACGEPAAEEAIDLYCYRLVREVGSLAAAIGGLDVLVFTGGIGEHAAEVRRRVCTRLGWLGGELDEAANSADRPRISAAGSQIEMWVIPTNEEWMIAHHTQVLLNL